jgi:hypothetical protein
MQSVKIACAQCPQHAECPQRVRLFVNYCGADHKRMDQNIRLAVVECRMRRGHLLQRTFALHPEASQVFGAVPAAIAA